MLIFQSTWRSVVLVGGESALIAGAVAAGSYLHLGGDWPATLAGVGLLRALLVVVVCQMCLYYLDLYEWRATSDAREMVVCLCRAVGAASVVLAVVYFWFPGLVIGRGVFLYSAVISVVALAVWRQLFRVFTDNMAPRERLLLVGIGASAVDLARELIDRRHELGVEIVGFVDPDPTRVGAPSFDPGIVGTVGDIPELIVRLKADRVVVSLSDARGKLPMEQLLGIRMQSGVTFDHLASVYEEYTGKIAVENLRPSWLIFASGFKKTRTLRWLKRTFDLGLVCVGGVAALPLMALAAVLVRLSSPGPILYHQERVGLNGRIFKVHKFRTMRQDAEAESGPVWSGENDPRVTVTGRLMRRTRLDEMPQLWNVLRGEMSFVGPRPERPSFVTQLTAEIPFYGQRHVVKPGLTGWAQVRYTYGASVEDAIQKLQYDLYYIKNLSLALDLAIVLETVKTVLMRRGAR